MLLEQIKGISIDAELMEEYNALEEMSTSILNQISVLLERSHDEMGDVLSGANKMPAPGKVEVEGGLESIMAGMDQVMNQMDAAKRAMGLVNKLADSKTRTVNKSRVMGNMNRIRGNIRRIEKLLAAL